MKNILESLSLKRRKKPSLFPVSEEAAKRAVEITTTGRGLRRNVLVSQDVIVTDLRLTRQFQGWGLARTFSIDSYTEGATLFHTAAAVHAKRHRLPLPQASYDDVQAMIVQEADLDMLAEKIVYEAGHGPNPFLEEEMDIAKTKNLPPTLRVMETEEGFLNVLAGVIKGRNMYQMASTLWGASDMRRVLAIAGT